MTMVFTRKRPSAARTDGKQSTAFLTEKQEELFTDLAEFVESVDEDMSEEEFLDALQEAVWLIVRPQLVASYHNGKKSRQRRQKSTDH